MSDKRKLEEDDGLSIWAKDRNRMTSVLVRLLLHRICWADKEDIIEAISLVEMDYKNHEREARHLCGGVTADIGAYNPPPTTQGGMNNE